MTRVQRTATDPETRQRALQRAAEVGASQASRETGVPASTIRVWQSRDRDQQAVNATAATGVTSGEVTSGADQLRRARRIADKAAQTAEAAIDRLLETIDSAKSPQSLAIATGVLLDKAAQLQDGIRAIDESQVRITEEQGQLLHTLIVSVMDAVGVPYDSQHGRGFHVRTLMTDLLRQAARQGDPCATRSSWTLVTQPDLAEAARVEAEEVFAKRLRPRIEREIREQLEAERAAATSEPEPALLGLPERSSAPLDGSEPMAGPRHAVVTFSEPQERSAPPSAPDVEVVDGEVVDEEIPALWLQAHHGNRELAWRDWQASLVRDREREARDRERESDKRFGNWAPSRHRLEGAPGPLGRLW